MSVQREGESHKKKNRAETEMDIVERQRQEINKNIREIKQT